MLLGVLRTPGGPRAGYAGDVWDMREGCRPVHRLRHARAPLGALVDAQEDEEMNREGGYVLLVICILKFCGFDV